MDYFNTFKKSAFRVETLQKYNVNEEQEGFANFLNHGILDNNLNNDWYDIIKKAKNRGASITRVHLIKLPLTDYLRFEIELYKLNEKYGEEIFILIDNQTEKQINDFWLFDDEFVLDMQYSDDGKFIDWKERKDNINDFINIKNNLLSQSIPLKDFNPESYTPASELK